MENPFLKRIKSHFMYHVVSIIIEEITFHSTKWYTDILDSLMGWQLLINRLLLDWGKVTYRFFDGKSTMKEKTFHASCCLICGESLG